MVSAGFIGFSVLATLVALRYLSVVLSHRISVAGTGSCGAAPDLTVVIVCFNEALGIRRTLESLHQQRNYHLLIVDDGSTDGTAEICASLARRDPRVQVIRRARSGKMPSLRAALRSVTTELLVTLDADTIPAPGALDQLARAMAGGTLTACSGNLHVEHGQSLVSQFQALEFALLNGDRAMLGRIGAVSILPGAFSVWHTQSLVELIEAAGNDIDLSLFALRNGHRLGFESAAVAFTDVPKVWRSVLAQRRRWAQRKINRSRGLARIAFGGRMSQLRARVAHAHILFVHVLLAPLAFWIDVWALGTVTLLIVGSQPAFARPTLGMYGVVILLGFVISVRSDAGVRNPVALALAGPWERLTRGIAALSAVVWPSRNTPDWTPRRVE